MAVPKRISAINSSRCVHFLFSLLMEAKDKITERHNNKATILVNSSKIEFTVAELMCSDVITMRQNPSKLEAVGRICCEVLLAIDVL